MKKIIIICFIFLSLLSGVFAADFTPKYSTTIRHFGIGVIQLTNLTKIYEERSENSKILQKIYWDTQENYKSYDSTPPQATFISFVPRKNYAFLSVEDEDDEWYYVCYNQRKDYYGWVRKNESIKFYTWFDFIDKLGRKNGLYTFNDIKQEDRMLYARPEDNAQVVDSWQYAKSIKPWHVNGNWVIVKLIDFDGTQKTGYLKWRNDDGRLNVFVKLK